MDFKKSQCVMAVLSCRRWDAAADVFHAIAVCEGRSGGPATRDN